MNWPRWLRIIRVTAVLALMGIFIALPSLVSASPDTLTLRPEAAGDEANLSPSGAANNWDCVDEVTSDDDTTYVLSDAKSDTFQTDLYNLPDTTVSGKGKINSVTVHINARAGGNIAQTGAYTRIKTNGATHNDSEITLTNTYTDYYTAYPTNPQTTNEWTWLEVNNLQAGVALRRSAGTGGNKESRCTQVWVVVDYTPATLESYKEATHETVWGTGANPYDVDTQTAFMHGGNYIASHSYHIGYYDGNGTKVQSEGQTSGSDNTLSGQYLLTLNTDAAAGTWYTVVFDDDLGSPPETYAACSGTAGYMVEDSFEVTPEAIPEFPTVMAGITVAGLCSVIYYFMRKRRLAPVKA